jgi:site-specific DNA recombinase
LGKLREFLASPGALLDVDAGWGRSQFIKRGHQIAEDLETSTVDKIKTILMTLLCRVVVKAEAIEIKISRHRLTLLLAGQQNSPSMQNQEPNHDSKDVITLAVPACLKRFGREMKLIIDNADDNNAVDTSLLRIIARAHDIQARLKQNTELTVHDVAREERVSAAYIYNLLRLPWLAPDITTAIVNGRQPPQLNAKTLMRRASRLPADWSEQRAQLGFR